MDIKKASILFFGDYTKPEHKAKRLRPVIYRCRDIRGIIKTKIESNEYLMGKSENVRKKLLNFLIYNISIAQASYVKTLIDIDEEDESATVTLFFSSTISFDLAEIVQLALICETADNISITPPNTDCDQATIYLKMSLDENYQFKKNNRTQPIIRPHIDLVTKNPK